MLTTTKVYLSDSDAKAAQEVLDEWHSCKAITWNQYDWERRSPKDNWTLTLIHVTPELIARLFYQIGNRAANNKIVIKG